ncbi:MAG: hypothetical protein IMY70_03365 [Bacteroidetes bacterium]|nr:hypothetical protein [Bacteroidota bacterium]
MKTIYLLLAFFLFFSLFTDAQGVQKVPNQNKSTEPTRANILIAPSGATNDQYISDGGSLVNFISLGSEGNMYLIDEWKEGETILKDGSILQGREYRYNIYAQQMQFIHGEDTLAFAVPEELQTITFDGRTFIYYPYKENNERKKSYFEVLTDGPCQLVLRREITYHFIDTENDGLENDVYILERKYFIVKDHQDAFIIPLNKKGVLSILGDKEEEISAFIRSSNLRVKNEDNLIKIIEYYNTL